MLVSNLNINEILVDAFALREKSTTSYMKKPTEGLYMPLHLLKTIFVKK